MIQSKENVSSGAGKPEPKKVRIKKAAVSKKQKTACTAVGGIVLLLAAVSLVLRLLPAKESVENTLYSYRVSVNSSYRVHVVANDLYAGDWLDAGKIYPEALTDAIELHLEASLQGSAPAAVSGSYQIQAVLEGYQNTAKGRQVVYDKQFPLQEGEISETDNGRAAAEETVQIQLAPYRQLADQADQILKTSVARDLSISFTGAFTVDTASGQKQQEFSYQVSLPIGAGTSLYEITEPDPVSKEGKITERTEVSKPVGIVEVLPPLCGGAAGLAVLLFSLLLTRLPDEEEAWRAEMKRILRKYGSRMIRLERLPDFRQKECLYVSDIDSMVAMAEEMRQPLLYCPDSQQLPQDGVFCISDAKRLCLLRIKRPSTTLVVDAGVEGGT